MNLNNSYKYLILSVLLILVMCSSCIFEYYDEKNEDKDDKVTILFSIATLGAQPTTAQSSQKIEKLKSLRIIIIDDEGTLEVNEKVSLEKNEYNASDFSYIFTRELNSNNKKLYLVGNEESVGEVKLPNITDIPKDLPLTSLSDLLSHFAPASETDETSHSGAIFEKVLNNVYFLNDFKLIEQDNSIFLPYSSFYRLDKSELGFSRLNNPFYLVPVATKIDFHFISYRSHDTRIEDMMLSEINSYNYLNAKLDPEETVRLLEDKQVWWIDWLEACAVNSQTAEDLEEFNEKWGWIENYLVPLEDQKEKNLNSRDEEWDIQRMIDKRNPDTMVLGPFYLPESQCPVYSLSFKVLDLTTKEETMLEGYEIDTLKTLFRGIHLQINVELYEKAMDIFAEIVPWEPKIFIGYVQEDDE